MAQQTRTSRRAASGLLRILPTARAFSLANLGVELELLAEAIEGSDYVLQIEDLELIRVLNEAGHALLFDCADVPVSSRDQSATGNQSIHEVTVLKLSDLKGELGAGPIRRCFSANRACFFLVIRKGELPFQQFSYLEPADQRRPQP